jgi:hypothetical protein
VLIAFRGGECSVQTGNAFLCVLSFLVMLTSSLDSRVELCVRDGELVIDCTRSSHHGEDAGGLQNRFRNTHNCVTLLLKQRKGRTEHNSVALFTYVLLPE